MIGYYWLAHHRFFVAARGGRRSASCMLNLVYLAAIAFMPFPTALVGIYGDDEPIAVVLYARHARRRQPPRSGDVRGTRSSAGLLRARMRDDVLPRLA